MKRAPEGFVAVELVLAVGVLLMPVALLVLTFPSWSEYQATATSAAADAARTAAIAGDTQTARRAAESRVHERFAVHGLRQGEVDVSWHGGPSEGRGTTVTVDVTVRLPAVDVPGVGRIGSWHWTATHAERVDDYRSR